MLRRRLLLSSACLATLALASGLARANDASSGSPGSESINVGAQENPGRWLYEGGVCKGCVATDVTADTRADGHNPEGINYGDCEYNLRLDFSLATTGFGLGDGSHVEIWAGTGDCSQDVNRAADNASHPCWQVAPPVAGPRPTLAVSVYARDILRYEASSGASTVPYEPTFNDSKAGEGACTVQPTDAAFSLGVYFIPIVGTTAVGTAYEYGITADTVGPPAPPLAPLGPGDTMTTVSWTSVSADPDVQGYIVYSDPPAGTASSGAGCGCGSPGGGSAGGLGEAGTRQDASALQCMGSEGQGSADATSDTGAMQADAIGNSAVDAKVSGDGDLGIDGELPDGGMSVADGAAVPEAGGVDDGGASLESGTAVEAGASAEAGGGAAVDAGSGQTASCRPIKVTGSGTCADPALTHGQIAIGAATRTTTTTTSEAGDDASTTAVVVGTGGISAIDAVYQAAAVDSTATSATLTGLTDGTLYHVVVAAVDGSDNVGPTSALRCATPAAVQDFWATYKAEGGGAGGCALESASRSEQGSVFGLGLIAVAAAWLRRTRR